jgi:hypothetical protein
MLWLPASVMLLLFVWARLATRLSQLIDKVVTEVRFKLRERNYPLLVFRIKLVKRYNTARS